ncbi:kazrin-like isoform X2 [Littorina saxatilis]
MDKSRTIPIVVRTATASTSIASSPSKLPVKTPPQEKSRVFGRAAEREIAKMKAQVNAREQQETSSTAHSRTIFGKTGDTTTVNSKESASVTGAFSPTRNDQATTMSHTKNTVVDSSPRSLTFPSKPSSPKSVSFAPTSSTHVMSDSSCTPSPEPRSPFCKAGSPGLVIKSVLKNPLVPREPKPDGASHQSPKTATVLVQRMSLSEVPAKAEQSVIEVETYPVKKVEPKPVTPVVYHQGILLLNSPGLNRAGNAMPSDHLDTQGVLVSPSTDNHDRQQNMNICMKNRAKNLTSVSETTKDPKMLSDKGEPGVTLRKPADCSKNEPGKDKPQQSVPPLCHGVDLSFLKELKNKHKFSLAFDQQNQVAATAIKSLDSLNDQIVQYIFGQADHHGNAPPLNLHLDPLAQGQPSSGGSEGVDNGTTIITTSSTGSAAGSPPNASLSSRERDNLHTSIVLIRRLLQDAQGKFRKMVEENKQLAIRIDGSIQTANQEVHALREELADTNKRLSQISTSGEEIDDKGGGGDGCVEGSVSVGIGGGSVVTPGSVVVNSGGTSVVGEGVVAVVRPGMKETDIDSCSSCGSSEVLDVVGGGSDGGCVRACAVKTMNGRDKMSDVVKDDVGVTSSKRTEMDACRKSRAVEVASCLGTGCQVSEDSATLDPDNLLLVKRLRDDNARLENQIHCLCGEVTSLKAGAGEGGVAGHPSYGELKLELIQARQELNRAKEALQAMKSDRKRLKSEKVDLLHQMKQLYVTLEDKESELRDFIRNYEQRVQESDESIKQLAMEKEESEREKWDIIRRARESAERSMLLRSQLDTREQTIAELQEEIAKLKEQLADRGLDESRESNNTTPTPADDNDRYADVTSTTIDSINSTPGGSGSEHRTPSTASATSATPCSTASESGSCHTPDGYLSKDDSFSGGGTPLGTPTFSDHGNESLSSLMKWMALSNDVGDLDPKNAKKKKKSSFGSLSRVFGRSRTRRSIALPHNESLFEDGNGTKLSLLTPDNYQEKLQTVDAMSGLHMCQWRAGQVLAWMEITLGMPMYGRNCALNIKSGKVLLGLSDSELGTALGITNHIHRRKLRLAIEEHRDPSVIKFPQAPKLDVTWVAHKLLPELGLPQYSHVFERNLVDGRILNSLGRRDLEKHFDIHRKFHQASILHAVELLRRMEFDREKLAERRSQCADSDSDLIVWTSPRLVEWIRSIDLGEFAENLQESGVHGALMVLEPSFNSDSLATALAIPPSKSYIRRHLATELDTLLRPARAALDTPNNNSKHLDPGGKGHTFTRSYRGSTSDDGSKGGRLSFRGSLGRAFGKKIRDDLKLAFDSDSPKWKISAPIPIQHTSLDNVVEIPGDSTPV